MKSDMKCYKIDDKSLMDVKIMTKKIISLLLIFIFMLISLLLANWQINKHQTQSKLTNQILTKNAKPANDFAMLNKDYKKHVYEEVILSGRLDFSNIQYIRNIIKYGIKGKNILIPLRMTNGINVLINTGWAPEELIEETTKSLQATNNNNIKGRIFIPYNSDAKKLSNGDWLGVSIPNINNQLNYKLVEWMIIEGAEIKTTGSYERYMTMPKFFPDHENIIIKNDVFHLGYAFTWSCFFIMGLFGMIHIYRN